MKLAIVTDSTAFLPDEIKNHPDLYVVPIAVILDGKLYNEGIDIEADDYYDLLKNSKEFPTTSQTSLGEMLSLYEDLGKKGYDTILSIHLSTGISGLLGNLYGATDAVEGVKIIPYDSKITSSPMGYMVDQALKLNDTGATLDEIIQKLDTIRDSVEVYFIVEDLNNLARGGRLTNGAALVAGLLKIKPVLTFEDGKIVLFEKIRSSKKAFTRIEDVISQHIEALNAPVKLTILHGNSLEVALEEKGKMQARYPELSIDIAHFGPVVGTHLGEKAIGFTLTLA